MPVSSSTINGALALLPCCVCCVSQWNGFDETTSVTSVHHWKVNDDIDGCVDANGGRQDCQRTLYRIRLLSARLAGDDDFLNRSDRSAEAVCCKTSDAEDANLSYLN